MARRETCEATRRDTRWKGLSRGGQCQSEEGLDQVTRQRGVVNSPVSMKSCRPPLFGGVEHNVVKAAERTPRSMNKPDNRCTSPGGVDRGIGRAF